MEKTEDNCYCGAQREIGSVELQCGKCMKWFHLRCLKEFKLQKCTPFMTNYAFLCKLCSPSGSESFTQRQSNFSQICVTALANLTFKSEQSGTPRTMFSRENDIIPYIDQQWEFLTTMPRRVKQTWHETVRKTMSKEGEFLISTSPDSDDLFYGLAEKNLNNIGPNYDCLIVSKSLRGTDGSVKSQLGHGGNGKAGRSAKRKGGDAGGLAAAKKVRADTVAAKLSAFGFPIEYPFNKDGHRYYLVEPDCLAPNRQEFDEGHEWAGKPIPSYFYRIVRSPFVLLSVHDRAPQLKLLDDRLTVTGDKGYTVVRCTHGVNAGSWFYEVEILEQPQNSHTRIGWSQALGCIQAPVGYDKFSYAWRSRKGTKFHDSIGKHYCSEGFGKGDVLGIFITLPKKSFRLPSDGKTLPLVKFKSHYYFEEKDDIPAELKTLKPAPDSQISFYKNGVFQGTAWTDVYAGTYYPAISLYKNIQVKANFGPQFKFAPATAHRPMSERADEFFVEQCMAEMLFFVENEGQLKL